MRNIIAAFAVAAALASPSLAQPAVAYSTAGTKVGVLLADPQAKAILDRHIPGLSTDGRIGLAKGMTLREIQKRAPKRVSEGALAGVDADFGKLGQARSN